MKITEKKNQEACTNPKWKFRPKLEKFAANFDDLAETIWKIAWYVNQYVSRDKCWKLGLAKVHSYEQLYEIFGDAVGNIF